MEWNKKVFGARYNKKVHGARCTILLFSIALLLVSCSVSYKLDGGTINYDLTKTIRITDFPNHAANVYPPLSQIFEQKIRDRYIEQTRLVPVANNADIEISGEITNYDIQGMAVKEDAYSSQSRLTISVRVQYVNNKEQNQDIEQTFSAFREYPVDQGESVRDELCRQICEELVDMIYNATVANW
jgi:hypothetical protein